MTADRLITLTPAQETLDTLILDTQRCLLTGGLGGMFAPSDSLYAVLSRWAALVVPAREAQRTLPQTREELAQFFGDIRLPNGAMVTGIFVEAALEALKATDE
jgi:hypothetical protein